MADVSANEVRLFFKNADPEIAELVYELAGETIKSRRALSSKISENMKKARQARGKGKKGANASTEGAEAPGNTETATPANNQTQAGQGQATDSPILAARARRASAGAIPSVPAPAHTADATSAESDVTIGG